MTSAGDPWAFVHEVRVSRDGDSWKVTAPFVFLMGPGLPFVACSRIGVQATNGIGDIPTKGVGTHEDP